MTIVEGRELYPIHKLVESRNLLMALSLLGALMLYTSQTSHLWSMLFACLLLFVFIVIVFFYIIPFLPGSPFRVFNPPGNSFFIAPVFA